MEGRMTDDRHRHSPGATSIERRDKRQGAWPNEGEGNKSADRAYRKGVEEFVKSGRVEEQARNAAKALDGNEGQDLRRAEDKGRKGKPRGKAR
jgi:hypothetical protein